VKEWQLLTTEQIEKIIASSNLQKEDLEGDNLTAFLASLQDFFTFQSNLYSNPPAIPEGGNFPVFDENTIGSLVTILTVLATAGVSWLDLFLQIVSLLDQLRNDLQDEIQSNPNSIIFDNGLHWN